MNGSQKSELVIAKILNVVLENGLQPLDLKFSDLGLDETEFEVFYDSTGQWLLDEGIICASEPYRTMGSQSHDIINPVLTAYGYSLMGQEFVFENANETVGSAVKKVAENQRDFSKAGDFTGGLLAGFFKNIGG